MNVFYASVWFALLCCIPACALKHKSEDVTVSSKKKDLSPHIIHQPFHSEKSSRSLQSSSRGKSNLFECVSNTPHIASAFVDKLVQNDFSTVEDNLETYCPGFPDGEVLNCEFPLSLAKDLKYYNPCKSVGGKIFTIQMDMCTLPSDPKANPVNMPFGNVKYYDSKKKESELYYFNEVHYVNYPVCAHESCTKQMVTDIYNSGYKNKRWDCPKDDTRNFKFGLRWSNTHHLIRSDVNTSHLRYSNSQQRHILLMTKTCQWLAKKPAANIARLCRGKKFQIYFNEYLPASQTCRETCRKYSNQCVAERQNSLFLVGGNLDEDGKFHAITRQCIYLSTITDEDERWKACNPELPYHDSRYGYGRDVCPESCVPPENSDIESLCQ